MKTLEAAVTNRLAAQWFTSELAARSDVVMSRFREEYTRERDPLGLRIREQLVAQSELLRIAPDTDQPKERVFRAYLHDCGVVPQIARGLNGIVHGTIRAGLKYEPRTGTADRRHKAFALLWDHVTSTFPRFEWRPNVTLDARTAGPYDARSLLHFLQRAYRATVDHFLTSFRDYLCELVRDHTFGGIEWTNHDICWYAYFRHGVSEKDEEPVRREERGNAETRTIETTGGTRTYFKEYHEHHLYNACRHSVAAYLRSHALPRRIHTWLSSLPPWFAERLEIVDGEIFLERVVRKEVLEERFVYERVIAVTQNYSPAVCLGTCVLVGWNGRDTREDESPYATTDDPELRLLYEAGLL